MLCACPGNIISRNSAQSIFPSEFKSASWESKESWRIENEPNLWYENKPETFPHTPRLKRCDQIEPLHPWALPWKCFHRHYDQKPWNYLPFYQFATWHRVSTYGLKSISLLNKKFFQWWNVANSISQEWLAYAGSTFGCLKNCPEKIGLSRQLCLINITFVTIMIESPESFRKQCHGQYQLCYATWSLLKLLQGRSSCCIFWPFLPSRKHF